MPESTNDELREHNEYDGAVTEALMREHSEDWDMETIREAVLIATNTMLPIIHQHTEQVVLEAREETAIRFYRLSEDLRRARERIAQLTTNPTVGDDE